MKIYTVRDAQGIMVMKLGGVTADNVIRDCSGKWRKWNSKDGNKYDCFELTDDMVFTLTQNDNRNHLTIYFWKGTKLIADNC